MIEIAGSIEGRRNVVGLPNLQLEQQGRGAQRRFDAGAGFLPG
jgi:hypothetical protein